MIVAHELKVSHPFDISTGRLLHTSAKISEPRTHKSKVLTTSQQRKCVERQTIDKLSAAQIHYSR